MGARFQIPLYKLFVVTAIYAVALGVSSWFRDGWQWYGVALLLGTVVGILVLVATVGNLYRVLEAGFWVLICACGMMYGAGPLFALDDAPGNWTAKCGFLVAAAIGVSVGGLLSVLFQRLRKSHAIPSDDSLPNSD